MIRYRYNILILSMCALLLSCQSVDIFDSREPAGSAQQLENSRIEPFLQVTITGGSLRVPEKMIVFPHGYAVVYEHSAYIEKRTFLSASRVQQIRDLFIENDILNLSDHIPDREAANSVNYDILFSNGTTTHLKINTACNLPRNIKNLIEGVDQIINDVINDGLKIELVIPQYESVKRDSLQFTLKVTNTSRQDIILLFPTAQEYDFYIYTDTSAGSSQYQWYWAEEKTFTQAIQYKTLPAQEKLTYECRWANRAETTTNLPGTYYAGGMLLSTPGGTTREVPIIIH